MGGDPIHPAIHPPVDDPGAPIPDTGAMTFTDYLLNGALIALVLFQVRGRRLTVRNLVLPFGVVAFAATQYLHGFPLNGNNLTLVLAGALAGALLGTGAGLATSVYRGTDGSAMSKAGLVAALLWILGVGARLAFELYSSHGGQGAIERFSVAHHITSAEAWVTALVLMALAEVVCRTAVIGVRFWKLTSADERRPAPVGQGIVESRGLWS